MKPTVAFLKFARAPAKQQDHYWTQHCTSVQL